MSEKEREAEFIPFEIVREERERVLVTPSRWQILSIAVIGILALIGIFAVGVVVVVVGLLVAIPLMILKGISASLFRR
ncbi:MAG: hypothetical protein WCN98_17455 [Verrucomicrobiaceae bacterium]